VIGLLCAIAVGAEQATKSFFSPQDRPIAPQFFVPGRSMVAGDPVVGGIDHHDAAHAVGREVEANGIQGNKDLSFGESARSAQGKTPAGRTV